MKSSGPWNLRGLRPKKREAARDAARRSGMSVGEWLNSIIRSDDGDDEPIEQRNFDRDADDDANRNDRDRFYHGQQRQDRSREPNRDRYQGRHGEQDRDRNRYQKQSSERDRQRQRDAEPRQDRDRDRHGNREQGHREQNRNPDQGSEQQRSRDSQRNRERQADGDQRSQGREQERAYMRESAKTREELGALHGRLDELSHHLERLSHKDPAFRPLLRRDSQTPSEPRGQPAPKLTGAPVPPRQVDRPVADGRSDNSGDLSIDDAVAEITARQRMLDNMPPAAADAVTRQGEPDGVVASAAVGVPPAAVPLSPWMAEALPTAFDVSGLERQLRDITARLEELRPSSDLAKAIEAVRTDLAEIAGQIKEALPRRAVEPLEIEIKALAARIDQSRQSGVDSNALAGLERGLAEIQQALRGLATSETLAGFDEAVRNLAQRLDLVATKGDPAALQQLEEAIGALRGIVSHVASNDTLNSVAENVRSLAATVDALINSVASGHTLAALESRVETLANAITASTEAGHAVPRELEKLLSGLIEKLEWVQLTHTDHAALGHLEDRIAALISRFDASDARLGHLEAIERGMADLLVHLERMRSANGDGIMPATAAAGGAIEREVAAIKQIERRTQDSLEAVQGTVEQVVERLAAIESGMKPDSAAQPAPTKQALEAAPPQPTVEPPPLAAAPATPPREPAPQRAAAPRPIDPDLPPDHPLEPGSATSRSRLPVSTAERIAASEAAAGATKPPVIPDPAGKSNFIAAARRAAQAAAATPAASQPKFDALNPRRLPNKLTQRLRALFVVGSAVLIAIFGLRVATRLFESGATATAPAASAKKTSPAAAGATAAGPAKPASPQATPLPSQSGAPSTIPSAPPNEKSGAATGVNSARQSSLDHGLDQDDAVAAASSAAAPQPSNPMPLWAAPDVTGSLPPRRAEAQAAAASRDLPATIGGPTLRAAALAGDAAADYEVAIRFDEGRGVPKSDDEAARWFERAAKQGLTLAQFRLGTLYEKGVGVKKDLVAARDLYLAAANKGNAKAMHNLAVLYAEGVNGPADYRTAAHWFRKAADHGISDSQYNLGILYARGIGVEQSFAESYKWFALAANQGDQEAAKKRDEVAAKLDAQSLNAARLAVRTWSPQPQPEDAISVKGPPGGWDAPAHAAAKPGSGSSTARAMAPATKVN
jgi:localization factor PodJL